MSSGTDRRKPSLGLWCDFFDLSCSDASMPFWKRKKENHLTASHLPYPAARATDTSFKRKSTFRIRQVKTIYHRRSNCVRSVKKKKDILRSRFCTLVPPRGCFKARFNGGQAKPFLDYYPSSSAWKKKLFRFERRNCSALKGVKLTSGR